MEIIVAKNIGHCFGVARAINEALKEVDDETYFLGELVHNKETLDKLNIRIVEDIEEIPDKAKVVIRVHGVGKSILKRAAEKKLKVIDLTCPKVLKVHKLVSERKNNLIVIIGKKDHPEVIGTTGYANEYIVIEDENDLEILSEKLKDNTKKVSVFSQTTYPSLEFSSLANKIKRMTRSYVEIISCICPVIEERQKEALSLAQMCDLILVIGDKKSSNTLKLYELSSGIKATLWIQNKNDLDLEKIKKYNKIGIISGTSTDIEMVSEIVSELKK